MLILKKFSLKFSSILLVSFLALFFLKLPLASAQTTKVPLYLFYSETCPHCHNEIEFLKALKQEIPELEIHAFEISKNKANVELLQKTAEEFEADSRFVPFTVIGKNYLTGYSNDAATGSQIRTLAEDCLEKNCPDLVGDIINGVETSDDSEPDDSKSNRVSLPEVIALPFFGDVEIKSLSLPVLTLVIGALDGFNPCAMWVLLFLISLLLQMQDPRRMWILGTAFILASGAVYFLFMTAWLNLFLFLGFIVWIRIIVGLVALFSGGYNLKEYWTNKNSACKVAGSEKRQNTFSKLKAITQKKQLWLALLGIVLLAGAVNLVELVCSAGLPAVYTKVLTLSNLPVWQYYLYLLLYIFIFMLDDMIVFAIAMITLRATGLTTKYTRLSHLIGGLLMLIIGLLLLFKPGWLMFG